ncbi:MAG TPA: hypothetical protein DCR51_06095 [Idiomarina loihiensis]|uniref:PD-(D/E)XK motif protein n=1 Tax=Idiomarina loihiensis TaxID=135577 RepID=UPI000E8B180E|nr:hypothetical protein [Idiomarina loihiensis]
MSDFTLKWKECADLGQHAGEFRVFPENRHDFFIGFSASGEREFSFAWRNYELIDPVKISLKKIKLLHRAYKDEQRLTLRLTDTEYRDLFSVICLDLATATEKVEKTSATISVLFQRLLRWSELLSKQSAKGLSRNEQLGLLGELSFLHRIIAGEPNQRASAVWGWRGPHGDTNDLCMNNIRAEVKAQLASQSKGVKVSSLRQLSNDGQTLMVVLYRLSPAESGSSLQSIIEKIENILSDNPDLLVEFQRKYLLTGFNKEDEYAKHIFHIPKPTVYKVSKNFPRLTLESVPTGITEASYFIEASALQEFEISTELLESLLHGKPPKGI